jgi:hypothetical protein
MTTEAKKSRGAVIAGGVAVLFGALTIVSGGRVLFGDTAARAAAGAVVPFVLWFNFSAGFAYLAAGSGLILRRRWATPLSVAIAAATVVVFAAFGLHIWRGGAFEMRTLGAMALRSLVWIAIAITALRLTRTDTVKST